MHHSKVYRAAQRLEDLQKAFKGIIYELTKHWLMDSVQRQPGGMSTIFIQ